MKKMIVLLSGFLVCAIATRESHAQSFKINLSPKHEQKLKNTKDHRKRLERYHKFYAKDSSKARLRHEMNLKDRLDSMQDASNLRSEVYGDLDAIKNRLNLEDTSAVTFEHLKQIAGEQPVYADELAQLNALETKYGPILNRRDSLLSAQYTVDSLLANGSPKALSMAEGMIVESVERMGGSEYGALAGQKGMTAEDLMPQQGQMKSQMELARGLASTDKEEWSKKSINQLSGPQMEKLKQTQAQMKLDKMKYSEIGDSNDMESAVKQSSLQGVSAKKRLHLGGNFQIVSTDPVAVELSPQLGYYFNKKWVAGLGLNYTHAFGSSGPGGNNTGQSYGGNLFTSYDITRSFFAHTELGWTKEERPPVPGENTKSAAWKNTFLIGLGMNMKISTQVDGRVMILYDVKKESDHTFMGHPVVIKFGFKLSEIGRQRLSKK